MKSIYIEGLVTLLLVFLFNNLSYAAQTTALTEKPTQKASLEIKNTGEFFNWFIAMKEKRALSAKSEFETEAAFKKRIPPPFDSDKIIYFRIAKGCWTDEKDYSYDITTKQLQVRGGKLGYSGIKTPEQYCVFPIALAMDFTSKHGELTGSCSYILNILNLSSFDYYLADTSQFTINLPLEPEAAKRISKSFEIVVGVRLPGYEQSNCGDLRFELQSGNVGRAVEETINAMLVKVIVRDRVSGAVLKEIKPTAILK